MYLWNAVGIFLETYLQNGFIETSYMYYAPVLSLGSFSLYAFNLPH
jgi:hypothetical protein